MSYESGWDRREVGWGDELRDPEYWNPDSGYDAPDPELDRLLADVPPHHDGPGVGELGE
jgi:hypothetical protein